ncbi:MAG TPA: hypothetical protein VL400_08625 [Polyangiaceae bacterium]|nr:hypothetical protein [Polyangiaceae bacterium]
MSDPRSRCSVDLDALAHGELDAEAALEARQHVAACPACDRELDRIVAERRMFAARARASAAPVVPSFDALMARAARPVPLRERISSWARGLSWSSIRIGWRSLGRGTVAQAFVAMGAAVVLLVGVSRQRVELRPSPGDGVIRPSAEVRSDRRGQASVTPPVAASGSRTSDRSVARDADALARPVVLASSAESCGGEEPVCVDASAEGRCNEPCASVRTSSFESSTVEAATFSTSSSSESPLEDCGTSVCVSEAI